MVPFSTTYSVTDRNLAPGPHFWNSGTFCRITTRLVPASCSTFYSIHYDVVKIVRPSQLKLHCVPKKHVTTFLTIS